jgi:hypothetical protein
MTSYGLDTWPSASSYLFLFLELILSAAKAVTIKRIKNVNVKMPSVIVMISLVQN